MVSPFPDRGHQPLLPLPDTRDWERRGGECAPFAENAVARSYFPFAAEAGGRCNSRKWIFDQKTGGRCALRRQRVDEQSLHLSAGEGLSGQMLPDGAGFAGRAGGDAFFGGRYLPHSGGGVGRASALPHRDSQRQNSD